MKILYTACLALTMFMAPAFASAADIDNAYAERLFELTDLDESKASVDAVFALLNDLERDDLQTLINLLDEELSSAFLYYWQQTRHARDNGLEPDFSGWQGNFLPGVSGEDRDRLIILLGYAQEKLGDC